MGSMRSEARQSSQQFHPKKTCRPVTFAGLLFFYCYQTTNPFVVGQAPKQGQLGRGWDPCQCPLEISLEDMLAL